MLPFVAIQVVQLILIVATVHAGAALILLEVVHRSQLVIGVDAEASVRVVDLLGVAV